MSRPLSGVKLRHYFVHSEMNLRPLLLLPLRESGPIFDLRLLITKILREFVAFTVSA